LFDCNIACFYDCKRFLGRRGSAVLETRERVKYGEIMTGLAGGYGYSTVYV